LRPSNQSIFALQKAKNLDTMLKNSLHKNTYYIGSNFHAYDEKSLIYMGTLKMVKLLNNKL